MVRMFGMWQRFGVLAVLWSVAGTSQSVPSKSILAFRGVTVISATGAAPLRDATVIVRGERIDAVGASAATDIPPGARIIDAANRYLVPGFIEMHAHLSKTRASALGLFVVNGVTTVRDMGGDHEELLRWRRDIASGRRVGPRMLIAGPYLESASNIARMRKDSPEERVEPFERIRIPIGKPEEATRVVGALARKELDYLKIRTVEDPATYLAINKAAEQHGLKVVGHVPPALTPDEILEDGQDGIEHGFALGANFPPPERRLDVWRRFARAGVPIVPTHVVFQAALAPIAHLRALVEDSEGMSDPRRGYLSKFLILDWKEQLLETTPERQSILRKLWAPHVALVRDMREAGMEIFPGSDVGVLSIFPGSSLHDEIELFVREIGMSPAEALERATRRSARFLGLGDSVGTIERGKIADMVLLDANPLDDINNTRRIAGVVLRGTFYDKDGLEGLLSDVRAAPDLKVDDWGRTAKR